MLRFDRKNGDPFSKSGLIIPYYVNGVFADDIHSSPPSVGVSAESFTERHENDSSYRRKSNINQPGSTRWFRQGTAARSRRSSLVHKPITVTRPRSSLYQRPIRSTFECGRDPKEETPLSRVASHLSITILSSLLDKFLAKCLQNT